MEQLNITAAKDNERIYKILGDLMNGDKEFQIMITVPSTKNDGNRAGQEEPKQKEAVRDLEQDVTDMIHEIGVPAHIKGYQYLREAIMMSVEDPGMISSITLDALFGYTIDTGKGKPTNSEFIALIADRIRLSYRE